MRRNHMYKDHGFYYTWHLELGGFFLVFIFGKVDTTPDVGQVFRRIHHSAKVGGLLGQLRPENVKIPVN